MNIIKKIFLISVCFSSLISMNQESLKLLTQEEGDCLKWFEITKTSISWGLKDLSEEDKNVFNQDGSYVNNMETVTELLGRFVAGFCQKARALNVPLKYNEEMIAHTLIKIREYVAARMFVFSQCLTKEERLTIRQEQYIKNPQAAYDAMLKYGKCLAGEHVRLNLIPDTFEAREKTAQEFTQNKMTELELAYGKSYFAL